MLFVGTHICELIKFTAITIEILCYNFICAAGNQQYIRYKTEE